MIAMTINWIRVSDLMPLLGIMWNYMLSLSVDGQRQRSEVAAS